MTKREAEINLTKLQYDILMEMDTEYCFGFSRFKNIESDKKILSNEFKKLKDMGLVDFHKGLLDDDGKVAGSGYSISYVKAQLVRDLKQKYEENDSPKYSENEMKEVLDALRQQVRQEIEEAQKANLEQCMVHLYRKLPEFLVPKPRHMSKKKKDQLWNAMCEWVDEYVKKPYKDISSLPSLKERDK